MGIEGLMQWVGLLAAGASEGAAGAGEVEAVFTRNGWTAWLAETPVLLAWLMMLGVVAVAVAAYAVTRLAVLPVLASLARRSRTHWDHTIIEAGVLHRLAWIVPLMVLGTGVDLVSDLPDEHADLVNRLVGALMIVVGVTAFGRLLSAVYTIYSRYPLAIARPIKGYLQVIKVLAYLLGGVFIVAGMVGQSPWYLVSGLGAMTAILLLIFRDTLLSLVAGVQLTSNDLVRVGDWIEMPQFDADGDVVDIALNSVKVQNWDKTFTVIPTHKFLEHSFRNWRSMFETGGRRIKRSIHLDMSTIRFLTPEEIEHFGHYALLKEYMHRKCEEIEAFNCTQQVGPDEIAHARRLTNIGTFRAYIEAYLRSRTDIRQDLTFLIRQHQPTATGLPLEIWVFTNDTRWPIYEGIQSDIFDHLLAIVPQFGLRIFQEPGGADVSRLADRLGADRSADPARTH